MKATGSFEQSAYFQFIWQDIFLFTNFLNSVVTLSSDVDISYMATENTNHSVFWF